MKESNLIAVNPRNLFDEKRGSECRVWGGLGVKSAGGLQCRPPNTITLIVGNPKKGPLILGNLYVCKRQVEGARILRVSELDLRFEPSSPDENNLE